LKKRPSGFIAADNDAFEFNVDYVLCGSDCESMTIEDLLAFEPDAADRFHRQWLGYTESQGSPSLRRAICKI
jgi:hypothetical protein